MFSSLRRLFGSPLDSPPSRGENYPTVRFDGVYVNDMGPGARAFLRFFKDRYVLCGVGVWTASEAFTRLRKGVPLRGIGIGQWEAASEGIIHFDLHMNGNIIAHAGHVLGKEHNDVMLLEVENTRTGTGAPLQHTFVRVEVDDTATRGEWPFYLEEGEFPLLEIHDRPGSPTRFTCDPRLLDSSRKSIPGAPHWASDVFFSPTVLDRYYRNKGHYDIQPEPLTNGGLVLRDRERHWEGKCLQIGGMIRMCLGVVGELRAADRRHWAQYNVKLPERDD